jgi:hypothetical protein
MTHRSIGGENYHPRNIDRFVRPRGQDFGPPESPGFDDGRRRWWGEDPGRFQTGRRFFHGFEVDADS